MAKRPPIPSTDDIRAAIEAAASGKGPRLAELVKAVSTDDLATAFGRVSQYHADFHALTLALAYASGMREQRAIQAEDRRQWRKEQRIKS